MSQREAFLKQIADEPWDWTSTRDVCADWLDDQGEHEEAERQRKVVGSERWLREFAAECGGTCTNYGEEDDYDNHRWEDITYEQVVQAGRDMLAAGPSGDEYWNWDGFVQMGSEHARSLMGSDETRARYWECFAVVTGLAVPPLLQAESPFSCSC